MASRTGKMQQWLYYKIRVTIQDRRDIIGTFMAFDRHMNLIIADAEEFRRVEGKSSGSGQKKSEEKILKRTLGLVLLRGENIVSFSIEGPPPPEERRNRQAPVLSSACPGIGKAAGRGISPFPNVNMGAQAPIPGLSGPVKGLGGPSPVMVQPGMNPSLKFPSGVMHGGIPPKFAVPGMQGKFPPFPPGAMPPKFPMSMPPMFPPGGIPNLPPGMIPKYPTTMYGHPGMIPKYPPGSPHT
ncbi:small nuclear ribonucleoprotein-associated protein B-like [Schistocerca gregaria]|uniref:small nuclear ribonucleoprotein-associated protein B-like n=1 Tax=Schistocerca gregaria TaxID=7010 RepID=UPI00211DEC47|nr:small nuclear ribonucleoprotein-associated protein B-like [Schistocerca gregaria]